MSQIGTLSEKSLHAALKQWYGRPGDRYETKVDDYVIDIVRDELLIEIQTRHLYRMKRKLGRLLPNHEVRVVHPIAKDKWIVRQTAEGEPISRRKSPKHGRAIDLFNELLRIPNLLSLPNLTIELLLTQHEEIWRDDGQGSWRRRGWSVHDYRLLDVVQSKRFHKVEDYSAMLPADLPLPFTNRDLAKSLHCRLPLARKMSYTLRQLGQLELTGKRGNTLLYEPA